MPVIRASSHGESRVRMLRIVRRGDRHDPRDLSVSCRFQGAFDAAFEQGRADGLPPGETLKNLIHGVVQQSAADELEALGLALCERLLARAPRISHIRVELEERPWVRLDAGGKPQGQAFTAGSVERRTVAVTSNREQIAVVAGLEDLALMRTAGFGPRTAREQDDSGAVDGLQRLFVGTLAARWTYTSSDVTFASYRQGVRLAIIESFAWHAGRSVHEMLYGIGDVVLATYQEIAEITLALQEHPYRPADLFAAGIENRDDLFVALNEPLGVVELTVERERVKSEG